MAVRVQMPSCRVSTIAPQWRRILPIIMLTARVTEDDRDSRGSGLGLPIARKLVLAHGGDIGIESTPGQGTEVTVALPR